MPMKNLTSILLLLASACAGSQASQLSSLPSNAANEHLGTVSFPVSCGEAAQAPFNRGVALLHDFWYEEARNQFDQLVKSDPKCAMAHWGVAMSTFHQIWDRPDPETQKLGWAEMQQAEQIGAPTPREQGYIQALADFFRPAPADFPARIAAYSAAMGKLYASYDDVDTGAFYALSLLAAKPSDDTTLHQEQKAMEVLKPLFARFPDNPGVVHYITHACDNPAMAPEGLRASNHYLEIAQSGPHAYHMPGHIYARLGLWQQDIDSQLGSIAASEGAETHGQSGMMDEPHSYDFLLYAYLQSGQDDKAKATLQHSSDPLEKIASMPGMGVNYMSGMVPYYQKKLPIFYALEMRNWQSAATMEPVKDSAPQVATMVYWARAIAHGHLKDAKAAQADLAKYDALMREVRKGKRAYLAEGTAVKIERFEMVAWLSFAGKRNAEAVTSMREAADLQDKVGQGEVDIPAREMLADILLEQGQPKQALAEYETALKLSPNRLNGLYHAAQAAEAVGDKSKALSFYSQLMKSTNNGTDSERPELVQARNAVKASQTSTGQ